MSTTSRFAPSPTGLLHLGHAYSAVLAAQEERFLVRIEDLDQTRCRQAFIAAIHRDLAWLGLEPAEPQLVQSARSRIYAEALDRLHADGLVYPCFCSRADIAEASSAPHGARVHYPGTCRTLPDDPDRRAGSAHSWRLDSANALDRVGLPEWREGGTLHCTSSFEIDDIIVARKDAPAAYHLACVIDDAASEVNIVTRGADLRASTPIQRLLQMVLGLPQPTYRHHRLVIHASGGRLAKRDGAPTLAAMRAAGVDGQALAQQLRAHRLPLGFTFLDA